MTENGAMPHIELVVMCVFLAAAGLIAFGIVHIARRKRRKRVCSAWANGVISDMLVSQRRIRWFANPATVYTPVYSYTVDGTEYKLHGEDSPFEPDFTVGAPATVMYDPRDSKRAYVASRTANASDIGVGVCHICVGGIVLVMLLYLMFS